MILIGLFEAIRGIVSFRVRWCHCEEKQLASPSGRGMWTPDYSEVRGHIPGSMSVVGWSALLPVSRFFKGLKALSAHAPRPLMAIGSSSSQHAMKACRSTLLASCSSLSADVAEAALATAPASTRPNQCQLQLASAAALITRTTGEVIERGTPKAPNLGPCVHTV